MEAIMNYGELFEKAWRIIWKHKVLWLFGILAGCSANRGGGSGSGTQYSLDSSNFSGQDPFSRAFPDLQNFFYNLERGFQDGSVWPAIIGIGIALACVILILWVISLVLGTFGRTGLVRGAWLADEGAAHLGFGQLWSESRPYFWRVLGLTLLLMVLGWVVGIILIIPIILVTIFTLGCGLILIIPLAIIAAWLISVWLELTIVAIVGENLSIPDGVRRGWEIIRNNLGTTIVVSLIIFIGSLIIGLLIGLPFLAIVLPVIAGVFSQTDIGLRTGLIAGGVILLLYLPVAIVLYGVLQTYVGTVWTLFFRRMTGRLPSEVVQPAEPLIAAADEVPEAPELPAE
jgi:hypothetical protein